MEEKFRRPPRKRPAVTRWGVFVSTSLWIKEHLLEVGADYTYNMWVQFKDYLERRGICPPYPAPSYQSFARYIWIMKKIGLIEPVGKERSKSGKPRVYYRIVPGKEKLEEPWANPQAYLYGEKVKLGKRRYGRRVLKRPPKPVGRPRKE